MKKRALFLSVLIALLTFAGVFAFSPESQFSGNFILLQDSSGNIINGQTITPTSGTYQINVTVNPENIRPTLKWEHNDLVEVTSKGKVTFKPKNKAEQKVTITVRSEIQRTGKCYFYYSKSHICIDNG